MLIGHSVSLLAIMNGIRTKHNILFKMCSNDDIFLDVEADSSNKISHDRRKNV